jgi:hypothetical protein
MGQIVDTKTTTVALALKGEITTVVVPLWTGS